MSKKLHKQHQKRKEHTNEKNTPEKQQDEKFEKKKRRFLSLAVRPSSSNCKLIQKNF